MANSLAMKAYRISRAPGSSSDCPYDPFAKLVFEPSIESDELFDALRDAYPALKTHTERKKQAVLDFLMEERQAIDHEITAFVQHTGTAVPTATSTPYSAPSVTDGRKSSTSASSSSPSASSRSAGSSPEIMTLKDMTNVWTANGEKPKIHTRRSMTTKEKEEYRRRRQMKACKECRSRKRKCNHDSLSHPDSGVSSKVKKRSSAGSSPSLSHNVAFAASQGQFPTEQCDSSNWAETTLTALNGPLDFLDFSPTVTDGSFDDFLLLPNDDLPMGLAADPLFTTAPAHMQPFDAFMDPFVGMPAPQSHTPRDTRSQSSGMASTPSTATVSPAQTSFDTTQDWNYGFGGTGFDQLAVSSDTMATSRASQQQGVWRSPEEESWGGTAETHTLNAHNTPAFSQGSRRGTVTARGRTGSSPLSSSVLWSNTDASLSSTGSPGLDARHSPLSSESSVLDVRVSCSQVGNAPMPSSQLRSQLVPHDHDLVIDGLNVHADPSASSRFGEHGNSLMRGSSGRSSTSSGRSDLASSPENRGVLSARASSSLDSRAQSSGTGDTGIAASSSLRPAQMPQLRYPVPPGGLRRGESTDLFTPTMGVGTNASLEGQRHAYELSVQGRSRASVANANAQSPANASASGVLNARPSRTSDSHVAAARSSRIDRADNIHSEEPKRLEEPGGSGSLNRHAASTTPAHVRPDSGAQSGSMALPSRDTSASSTHGSVVRANAQGQALAQALTAAPNNSPGTNNNRDPTPATNSTPKNAVAVVHKTKQETMSPSSTSPTMPLSQPLSQPSSALSSASSSLYSPVLAAMLSQLVAYTTTATVAAALSALSALNRAPLIPARYRQSAKLAWAARGGDPVMASCRLVTRCA